MSDIEPTVTRIEHYHDIRYAVVATWKPGAYHVDFKTHVYFGDEATTPAERQYQRAGSPSSPDPVATLDEAEVFASGSVKWDGCSNFRFDEQDSGALHTCSREALVAIGTLLGRIHDIAAEMMPNANWEPETTRAQREGSADIPVPIANAPDPWCQSCQAFHATDEATRKARNCFGGTA